MSHEGFIKLNPRYIFQVYNDGLLAKIKARYNDLRSRGIEPKGLPKGDIKRANH